MRVEMSWYILILAGLFEIGWAIGLEYSDGLSKPVPTLGTAVALVVSMVLLAQAIKDLPIGVRCLDRYRGCWDRLARHYPV